MALTAPMQAEIERNFPEDGLETGRLFHGRGQTFAGFEDLNIDLFAPVVVVTIYSDAYDVDEIGTGLFEMLQSRGVECVLLQDRSQFKAPSRVLAGELPERVEARENGMRYGLKLMANQNLGFFPDMRLGRELVAGIAKDRKLLNLFAYTCSFSVAALAAGAAYCCNMDISKGALKAGQSNHSRNKLDLDKTYFARMDVLKSFSRMRKLGPWDIVVIDPPSRQGPFVAERDYRHVVRRLHEVLNPGADIIACLNAPHLDPSFLDDLFDERYQPIARLGRPDSFPEAHPERGLKIHHYRFQPEEA